jgi:hypothetical protein
MCPFQGDGEESFQIELGIAVFAISLDLSRSRAVLMAGEADGS